MMLAENFAKMQDLLGELVGKMGIRDANLKKLGVEEMLKTKMSGVTVESVEEFDEQVKPT